MLLQQILEQNSGNMFHVNLQHVPKRRNMLLLHVLEHNFGLTKNSYSGCSTNDNFSHSTIKDSLPSQVSSFPLKTVFNIKMKD